ncbi:MAG TPA: DUF885 domain-containing protein [Candidatus Limnocylindrales bacterium]|nr:DUF885 domain-containing protein [Candidatus Limnocylindrales bacterium]
MSDFASLVDEFLTDEFESSPVMASYLGMTAYDERLDDMSAAAFHRRDSDAHAWLDRFEKAGSDDLSTDDEIDRQLGIAMMRGRLINADWQVWKRDPTTYSGPILNGLFYLFLNGLRPTADLVDAAISRLEQVPGAVEQATANLDPQLAHPLILERGAASVRAGARYARDMLATEADNDSQRDLLVVAGAAAGDALEQFAAHIDALVPQAKGTWQYSGERYSAILRDRERLDHDAASLREMGQSEYDRLDAEMRELSRDIDGSDDWHAVLGKANDDHPRTEEEMRRSYADWTEKARVFLAETGLVTLPDGESCSVEPAPVFTRPLIAVASYSGPPAFSDQRHGHFFVPIAPDGTSEEEIQSRLASNSFGSIPTTAVHEAYPGHHWHITWSKLYSPKIRRVLQTPYFSEGWALYAERVMRERGFFTEPIQELYHLEATIFRAARIVVDTSLHMGEMTYDEAVKFMVEKSSLTEPTARAEVGRYCSWPTQASSYLTGCLEILRIRDRYLAARGVTYEKKSDIPVDILRDFHDRLAGSGRLPVGLAEQALMATLTDAERIAASR